MLLINTIPINSQNVYSNTTYQLVALASYKQSEYAPNVYNNMREAARLINQYFEVNSLTPSHPFSYLEAMHNFQGPGWDAPFGLRGAGACEVATLVFRAIENYDGIDLDVGRDTFGNDIIDGLFVQITKFDHNQIVGNFPRDKIAVYYNSSMDQWNRDLKLSIIYNPYTYGHSDIALKIKIKENTEGDFIAEIYSNLDQHDLYQIEENK